MKAYTFSDVLIIPKYSDVESRRDVDISSNLGTSKNPIELLTPVISANMKSITESDMAVEMRKNGGLGILHRFNTINEAIKDFTIVKDAGFSCGVSLGVNAISGDHDRFDELYKAGARIFCIDVAHGNSRLVKEMTKWIKNQNYSDVYLIVGNIATFDGAYDLVDWGANCVKVGIGPGSVCETRYRTGVGVPQLYALQQIKEGLTKQGKSDIKIISDGGITCVGDICKAMKYSDSVMVGSFISGTTETPGKVFKDENGQYYKVYAGSSSGEHKSSNGAPTDFIEGIAKKVPFRGHVKYIIQEILDGMRSSFSYVGALSLKEFQEKCEFIEITSGGKVESKI
jgi:IMP dehydrogenase